VTCLVRPQLVNAAMTPR